MIAEYSFLDLIKAIRTCVNKPRYHVGIFTSTVADSKCACKEAYSLIKEDVEMLSAVDGCIDRSNDQFITFNNGSYIKFISASINNTRGHRFHHILYVKQLSHETITYLGALHMRYMEEHNGTSRQI